MAGIQLQMTWQPNLLKKRKNGPPLGFKNLGNTCYLNAVLQCLTYTPPLANFCLQLRHSDSCDSPAQQDKKSDCPFCLLEKRIVRSLSIDLTLDTPGKIISGLKTFAEHFRLGRQEDAHEFLRYVIDACHTTCLRLKKLQQQKRKYVNVSNGGGEGFNGSTVVKEIFGGALQSQVKCLACGNESNKIDEIMDISVDVLNSSSLKEAFQKFFQPEILDGNNKYKCDSCKKLVPARKQMSILQAPNILVIQLKRFEGLFGGKIDKAIAFEEVLVLSSFMCKTSQDPYPEYKLFATIVHSGFSPDSGHYYAYIKDAFGRWYCCNDSYVSDSTLQEVSSEKVYILFFSRTKQRPMLPTTKTVSTNGTKTHESNGTDTSKVPKLSQTVKSSDPQEHVNGNNNNHFEKTDSETTTSSSKVEKVVFVPQKKLGVKKVPNMKIMVHNKENNGDAKGLLNLKKTNGGENNKKIPLLEDKNGSTQNKHVVANGNGNEIIVGNGCKSNGTGGKMGENGVVKDKSLLPDKLDGKRKHEEEKSWKLLSDGHEELKESLMKETSSFLRTCGWSDEVQRFMRDAKKLCAPSLPHQDELKRKLIAEAKETFTRKIPQELKTSLIDHIRAHLDP